MAYTEPQTWPQGGDLLSTEFNREIRDNFRAMGPHLLARKTSDQSVVSSTAFVTDSALAWAVALNEVWLFELALIFDAASAGDLKVSFSLPGGEIDASAFPPSDATGIYQDLSWQSLTTTDSQPFIFAGVGAGTNRFLGIKGVYVGAAAGTVALRWAQGTSSATATRVRANSTLWGVKLA